MFAEIDWDAEWHAQTLRHRQITDAAYWNDRAPDYAEMIRSSKYHTGEELCNYFRLLGVLPAHARVLDIAAGPGSFTIPFAQAASTVIAVEPSAEMIHQLQAAAAQHGLSNITTLQSTWQRCDLAKHGFSRAFDVVTMGNATLQFADVGDQLLRIDSASRGICCVVDSLGESHALSLLHQQLDIAETRSEQLSLLFHILRARGIDPNIHVIRGVMRRPHESAVTWLTRYLKKYRAVTATDEQIIREHVVAHTVHGEYRQASRSAALWWYANATD